MPADIRSFFAPKGSQGSSQGKPKAAEPPPKKKAPARRRRVVDSDDDDEPPKKITPKKPAAKQTKKEEKLEPTTASEFFGGDKNKVTRTTRTTEVRPARAAPIVLEDDDDDEEMNDVFIQDFKKPEDDYKPDSDDAEMEDVDIPKGDKDTPKGSKGAPKGSKDKAKAAPSRKRKSLPSDDEEDEIPKKKPASAKAAPKKPRAAPKKAATPKKKEESEEMQQLLADIPLVRPPTPPRREEGQGKKFDYKAFASRPTPASEGSKQIPEGAENCLTGLTFVFTGVLESLSREDGQQLVKRYGGKVTGAPSKKTSFVVLGSDAGPKKLETIRDHKIKTIDEDGLFQLIRTLPANGGSGTAAKANEAKKAAEEEKARAMAAQMEKEAKERSDKEPAKESSQLWTVKYNPTQINQICGNKGLVEKLQRWLRNWPKNRKVNFVKRGEDGSGGYRAAMIHGPPGIGKTTAAHLVANLEGYDVLEFNASDTRSKKLMEETLRGVLDNKSIMGYFGANKDKSVNSKRLVLIMDEVDGMSAGDRGGVGQLAAVCRKTNVPIICICNERRLPKMKPFDFVTMDMGFRRPDANAVRSRIMSIAFKEGLKLPPNVIDQLVEGTHSDIRQIINMMSTYKTTQATMDFDQGKQLAKDWEKHVVFKPWDIASRLLGTQMFGPTSKKTLNDKVELYFNDHEFSYLMIQENYLKTQPSRASGYSGRERTLKLLELADKAAQSISDGDLADSLIHGTQQQWSLMPVHGMLSTVIPSSFMYGGLSGQMSFTSWLGNNSKHGKLSRFVKEIQSHIRLRASGDRHEVRQQYIPALFNLMVRRLQKEGKDSLPEIIELMDEYFLTKDDWDAIIELGVGPHDESTVDIPSQTKAAFTRAYNQMSHPLTFMKATSVTMTKASKKEVPDIEDAILESDDETGGADADAQKKAEADEADISKDKYVKQPKKKAAPRKKAGKTDQADGDDAKKPAAKGKAKAKTAKATAGKGRGKAK